MIVELKILNGMCSDVVKLREQRSRYRTNRGIKAYSLYIWLKNLTPSGYIHNYETQLVQICQDLKISRATFYNYLNTAEALGLITRKNSRLELTGWDKVVEDLILPGRSFRTIYYDTENKKHKLHQLIELVEFQENQEKQSQAITTKLAKNPQVKAAFDLFCNLTSQKLEFNLHNLSQARRYIFRYGTAESIYFEIMNKINPELYRNSATIAAAHGYKSQKSATYLKRKLKASGLVSIIKMTPTGCEYRNNRRDHYERGKNTNGTTRYIVDQKVKAWLEPEKVILNQMIFTAPQAQ